MIGSARGKNMSSLKGVATHAATTIMPTDRATQARQFAAPLLWRTDATGVLVAGAAAWASYAGMAEDLLAGFGWLAAVHPEDRAATRVAWEQGATNQAPFEIEQRLIGGDGLARPFLTQAQPELDATGTLLGWHCLSMDIGATASGRDATELEQRTHEALDALLAMAEALVQDATTEHVAQQLAELTRSVLGCRRVALSALGPDGDLIVPYAVVGLTPEQTALWWEDQRANAIRLSEPGQAGNLIRLRAGEILHLDMTQPPYDAYPNPLHIHDLLVAPLLIGTQLIGWLALDHGAVAHQYTPDERRLAGAVGRLLALVIAHERLRQEREAARAETLALAETNRRMHEFLSIASHELRTPLTAIRANVQIATKWLATFVQEQEPHDARPQRARDLLQRADQNIQRLDDLVNDLLDVTRIQQGRLALRRVPTDLAHIVREAVAEQRIAHPDRTITLALAAAVVPIEADPQRISQVITNFLTNALKYSPAERPVAVRLRLMNGVVRVDVQDRGQGLPRSEYARVWQPFYRAPGVVVLYNSGVGLGLGLAICKSIIERHKGRVGITSTPKRGATFWFQLPLAVETAPASE
jgi:signal transduction histidine kinase